MLPPFLRFALRTLRHRLGYALVSGLGLVVGLACAGLVALYLQVETSYDTFHEDAGDIGRIYRIAKENPDDRPYPRMQGLVGRQVKSRVAGIEHVSALHNLYRTVQLTPGSQAGGQSEDPSAGSPAGPAGPDARLELPVRSAFFVPAGDGFLKVFSGFEVLRGDADAALQAPGEAVLTASTARRLFGTLDVVGRAVSLDLGTTNISPYTPDRRRETLTVRAVVEDVPARSHFSFRLIYSVPPASLSPNWSGAYTYVELAPGANREAILAEVMPTWDGIAELGEEDVFSSRFRAVFEPLTDIHLYTTVGRPLGEPTDVRYLWALGILAVILLVVAGSTSMNLAAATYADRSREVGTRRALGARSGQISRQFAGEAMVLSLLAVPLAVGLASALTPGFNQLMDTRLPLAVASPWAWLGTGGAALLLGGASGLYPTFGVARRPVPRLFEGSAFARGSGLAVRRGLIVVQFALFVALASAAVLMQQQMTLLQEKDLGFRPSGLVEITNGSALTTSADADRTYLDRRNVGPSKAFQRELRQSPLVEATAAGSPFLEKQQGTLDIRPDGAPDDAAFAATWSTLTPNGPEVLGLEPRAGAFFDRAPAERRDSVALVNAHALERLGCSAGALADCVVESEWDGWLARMPVAGVFENARFSSLRYGPRPIVVYVFDQENLRGTYHQALFVRFREGVPREEQTGLIESTWDAFLPGRSAEYEVLTERIDAFYAQERRLRTLGLGLTGVALVLVMLGLVSITAYLTRLRLREVAIRKALGATATDVLTLLNREFVRWVGIAVVVGSAIAYLAMDRWLAGFAARISISPLVFLAVGAGALALAVAAVSARSLPAARLRPARVLQSDR
jgi:putative ABC transport system permease protein